MDTKNLKLFFVTEFEITSIDPSEFTGYSFEEEKQSQTNTLESKEGVFLPRQFFEKSNPNEGKNYFQIFKLYEQQSPQNVWKYIG